VWYGRKKFFQKKVHKIIECDFSDSKIAEKELQKIFSNGSGKYKSKNIIYYLEKAL
jgi:hypothetical protein